MTSRERVLKAFAFEETEKVPAWCGASPDFIKKAMAALKTDEEGVRRRFGDDFRRVSSVYREPGYSISAGTTWKSPFGVERTGIGYGQPTAHPLKNAVSVKEVLDYHWPIPDWADISHIKKEAQKYNKEFAVLGGEWSPYFHDAIDLFGMEEISIKMYEYPEVVHKTVEKILDYYYAVSERIFEEAHEGIDIFFIGNDFGSQIGPLVSVELFDRFLLPPLKKLIDLGHRYDLKVMLHCCGGIRQLLPSMIKAGLDGIHALQPNCRGMESKGLKNDFGTRILLNGGIDSQNVLIEGFPDYVKRETSRILNIMAPGGGYVAGASHDFLLEETPLENVLAMFDTINNFRLKK
jgi:uroporphyrinogen decarboxylase